MEKFTSDHLEKESLEDFLSFWQPIEEGLVKDTTTTITFTGTYTALIEPLKIVKIVFNKPATIVWFDDGDKIVVKTSEDEEYVEEFGVAMAVIKKMFGSRSAFKKFINSFKREEKE